MTPRFFLFDFDGTITSADTMLCFIRYACGKRRFLLGFALFSPLILLMKLHLYANWRVKQQIFSWFFRGMKLTEFDDLCRRFAADNKYLIRPDAYKKLDELFLWNQTIAIVTASIENWVIPFFDELRVDSDSDFRVIGTKIEVDDDGRLTGRFLTFNCYGYEKLRRVIAEFPIIGESRLKCDIVAYGDSQGDRELLAYAHTSYYRYFNKRNTPPGRKK